MPEPALADCQSLTEDIQDWKTREVQVDPENRLVRNVALTGRESKNGYRYSEQALIESLPLYENKPVFLDHAHSRTQPHQRSTRDLVGSVVNARYENGRIRGDIRVIDTEAGRTFLALAESNGPAVGMSHVILAAKNADGSVVEKIHEVVSVDAVVFPATTKTFQEQHDPAETGDALPASLARVTAERDRLNMEVARLKTELELFHREREVDQLLGQAQLPALAVTDVFRGQLLAAPSAEARRMLIEERRSLLDSLSRSPRGPHSQERLPGTPLLTDEQLITAIRRR
jgi:hypothetical protein